MSFILHCLSKKFIMNKKSFILRIKFYHICADNNDGSNNNNNNINNNSYNKDVLV